MTYDDAGAVSGYDARVVAGFDTTRIAPADGSARASELPLIFLPGGSAGLGIAAADSVTTDVVRDEHGHEEVSAQEFTLAGARWRATFTGYGRDEGGRVTGLTLRIDSVP